MELKKYIIGKSKELGIDVIGFTDTSPFIKVKELLSQRREKGYETEFEEENLDLRCNPLKQLSHGKTIIVIGISYNVEYENNKRDILRGRLSKSSWGIDYHKVLKEKMELLVSEIKKITEFEYKIFVDTGPLIDREIAKRAGIGWYGRNCSIINDKYGSFIFIGYIITSLDLEKDEPVEEKCGECDLCIRACPTGAIKENYTINSKKCISYLTQTKERIPYELRDKMGIKIYGCDTCQLVCPKNKNVIKGKNMEFFPEGTGGYVDLKEIVSISNKEFREKYGHMAGSWRGRNILRRNAILALGNIKDKGAIDILEKTLKDSSPMIREYSSWALMKIDRSIGSKLIQQQIALEKDKEVMEEMKRIIEYFEGDILENRNNR